DPDEGVRAGGGPAPSGASTIQPPRAASSPVLAGRTGPGFNSLGGRRAGGARCRGSFRTATGAPKRRPGPTPRVTGGGRGEPWRVGHRLLGRVVGRGAMGVRGLVRGVGFGPFVHTRAARFQRRGLVKNQTGSVLMGGGGEPSCLGRFRAERTERPPPLAQIE